MTVWFGSDTGFVGWMFIPSVLAFSGVVVWVVRRLIPSHRHHRTASSESPKAVLDRRFERGEIDLASYLAERDSLLQSRWDRR